MTTIASTQPVPREAARAAPEPTRSPGPLGLLAAFAAVPVAVAAVVAFATPAAALVAAFALVVGVALALALRALDMAGDGGELE